MVAGGGEEALHHRPAGKGGKPGLIAAVLWDRKGDRKWKLTGCGDINLLRA